MGTTTSGHPVRTLAMLATFLVLGVGAALYAMFVLEPGEASTTNAANATTNVSQDAAPDSGAKPTTAPTAKAANVDPDAAHVHGVVRLYRTKAVVEGP